MKDLDLFSRRFLTVTLGLSVLVLSIALLNLSVSRASAADAPLPKTQLTGDISGAEIYPFGHVKDTFYWIEYNNKGWQFASRAMEDWTN